MKISNAPCILLLLASFNLAGVNQTAVHMNWFGHLQPVKEVLPYNYIHMHSSHFARTVVIAAH